MAWPVLINFLTFDLWVSHLLLAALRHRIASHANPF